MIKIVNELQSFVEDPEISPDLRKKHKLEIIFLKEKQQKVVDKLKAITQQDDLSQQSKEQIPEESPATQGGQFHL